MATYTRPGWCPPVEGDRAPCRWTIAFLAVDPQLSIDYWSTQSTLVGGYPDGVDLEKMLTAWFRERGGPAAWWRLTVRSCDDEHDIAKVELWFEAHHPPVKPRPRKWRSPYVQYPEGLE
ncbi:hypothetical protein [Amycolatopsis sp. NPDC059657]|uniref:hypothetical protein n=1 Tax=Amycolatopsis sp. NPDC059657 TaxID=3346899 RepID=UPI00366E6959